MTTTLSIVKCVPLLTTPIACGMHLGTPHTLHHVLPGTETFHQTPLPHLHTQTPPQRSTMKGVSKLGNPQPPARPRRHPRGLSLKPHPPVRGAPPTLSHLLPPLQGLEPRLPPLTLPLLQYSVAPQVSYVTNYNKCSPSVVLHCGSNTLCNLSTV